MRITSFSFVLASLLLGASVVACGDDSATATSTTGSGSGGAGGEGTAGPTTTTTSAGSTSSTGSTGSTSSTTSSTTSSSQGGGPGSGGAGPGTGSGGGGGAGQGGGGGSAPAWPECVIESFGGVEQSILDVWTEDPSTDTVYWLPDVVVTAVSGGACVDGSFCQIFVQQQDAFTDLAEASQQAIRVLVAPEVSSYFTDVAVGDHVDLGGEAKRDTTDGRNELRFFVGQFSPGCMSFVDVGDPVGVEATLADLTVASYEDTMGPVLVHLTTVSGRPHQAGELFALWDTELGPQGSIDTVTSMAPTFIPGGLFVGLVPEQIVDFESVTGVYGQFRPTGSQTKYETLYVRSMGDAPLAN